MGIAEGGGWVVLPIGLSGFGGGLAGAADDIGRGAIGSLGRGAGSYGDDIARAAGGFVDDVGKGAGKPIINPGGTSVPGRSSNCANCVIATDSTWAGRPASAMPTTSSSTHKTVIEEALKSKFNPVSGQEDISMILSNLGPGSQGVVFGKRQKAVGHFFNVVVNKKGKVIFFDSQTFDGIDAATSIPSWEGFSGGFELLISHSP